MTHALLAVQTQPYGYFTVKDIRYFAELTAHLPSDTDIFMQCSSCSCDDDEAECTYFLPGSQALYVIACRYGELPDAGVFEEAMSKAMSLARADLAVQLGQLGVTDLVQLITRVASDLPIRPGEAGDDHVGIGDEQSCSR